MRSDIGLVLVSATMLAFGGLAGSYLGHTHGVEEGKKQGTISTLNDIRHAASLGPMQCMMQNPNSDCADVRLARDVMFSLTDQMLLKEGVQNPNPDAPGVTDPAK